MSKETNIVSYDEKSLSKNGKDGKVIATVKDANGKTYKVEVTGDYEAIKVAMDALDASQVKVEKSFKVTKKVGEDTNE